MFDYVECYMVRVCMSRKAGDANPSLLCPLLRSFSLCRTLHAGTEEEFMELLLRERPVGCEGLVVMHTHTKINWGGLLAHEQIQRREESRTPQYAHAV